MSHERGHARVVGRPWRVAMLRSLLHGTLGRAAVASALPRLWTPLTSTPLSLVTRGMKVMQTLKKRCDACMIVKRGKIRYVYCKLNPRHKARNGPKRRAGWLDKRPNA